MWLICFPLLAAVFAWHAALPLPVQAAGADFSDEQAAQAEERPQDASSFDQSDPFSDDYDEEDMSFLEEEVPTRPVSDPLEPWNRAMFHFNDKMYFWFLKPVAEGYAWAIPAVARVGVKNFFFNVNTPVRLVNCLLQGKGEAAHTEWVRLLFNTAFGFLGFWDSARIYLEVERVEADLGQTIGKYGVGSGWYIVWPVIGPSTLRDTAGETGDMFLSPTFYVEPFLLSAGIWSFRKVNDTSFRIGDYETIKEAAFEPYAAIRDGYIQYRRKKLEQ